MALLTCSDVTFSYEGIPVLTDVNFALEAVLLFLSGQMQPFKAKIFKIRLL